MSNPNPKSKTQIISELQKENEELKKRVLHPKPSDQDFLGKPIGPTGPVQTCVDKDTFKPRKRATKPPTA